MPARHAPFLRFGASLLLVCALSTALASSASAALRDYTVRWLPSSSPGVDGYELMVSSASGQPGSLFDVGQPAETNGELRYTIELDDSVDLYLRMRAYGGGATSDYSNEIVVAASATPGEPDFGVSDLGGASGVVSGGIVVVAETFGATRSVHFLVDDVSYRIENRAPYSIQGDGGSPGTERAFDTTQLADGEHTITAIGYSEPAALGVAGAAVSSTFYVDNAYTPDPDPGPDPGGDPDPDPDPAPDPGTDPPVGPEGAIAGFYSTGTGDIVALHVDGTTTVLANHALARPGELRPAWCRLDADADLDLVLGFGAGSEARLLLLHLEGLEVVRIQEIYGVPASVRGDTGETFPACGDVDGDGRDEIAVGLGAGSLASLWMIDDFASGFAPIEPGTRSLLGTVPGSDAFLGGLGDACDPNVERDRAFFSPDLVAARNGQNTSTEEYDLDCSGTVGSADLIYLLAVANVERGPGVAYMRDGSARPVLADIDGDGLDEIIVGRSEGGLGTVSILDDARSDFAFFEASDDPYGRLFVAADAGYREEHGGTEVAAADIDGDGLAEIVVGTGTGGGSLLFVYDDAQHGFAPLAGSASGLPFGLDGYNQANGRILPTLADVDGDGLPEIGLGFGEGGEGMLQLRDDLTTGFAPLVWTGDAEGLVRAPSGTGAVAPRIQPTP